MRRGLSSDALRDIGMRIRELRVKRGLSQEAVAELCDLSTSLIGHIERAEKAPSLGTIIVLSEVFHVSIDYLILGRADIVCDRKQCPLYTDLKELISRY